MSSTLRMKNGHEVPLLGLGTWLSETGHVHAAVSHAIEVGYRHIDCAWAYLNEKEVGEAIAAKIKDGTVKREDLFITSKLWNSFHRPDLVLEGLKTSLADLKLDYLDLYLVHWPVSYKPGNIFPDESVVKDEYEDVRLVDTWKAMEDLLDTGKVRSIGISNFNIKQIQSILDNCRVKPVMHQIEIHAYFPNKELVEFCWKNDIQVTAYSPLGSPSRPMAVVGEKGPLDDERVQDVAKRMKITAGQVLISYVLRKNIACIPKSTNPARIEENFRAQEIKLSDEDFHLLDNLNVNKRMVVPDVMKGHKEYPFEN